jgi:hypothetical protein
MHSPYHESGGKMPDKETSSTKIIHESELEKKHIEKRDRDYVHNEQRDKSEKDKNPREK